MAQFLRRAVEGKLNVIVSGGTGSGKTTLLNVLSSFIPLHERLITIEDAAELQLQQPHVVRLETRQSNVEGAGAVSQADLLKNTLRMRPDRIIIGEVRGGEALAMLQAMNTGHEGSLTTVHANTCRDALARLETMVLMAGMDLPHRAIREQVASALDLIVQIERAPDGRRRVTSVTEVVGMEGEVYLLQELFRWTPRGKGPNGELLGVHAPSGIVPRCLEKLDALGLSLPLGCFKGEGAGC
jgi:pilus assembly protein CpaF